MLNLSPEFKYTLKIVSNVVLFSFLFLTVSCNVPKLETKSNAQTVNTPAIQNSIEKKAQKLKELYENKDCKEFFKEFPNTFQEFNQLYGFVDDEGERILYSKYEEHIPYLYNCSQISDIEKLKRSVKIGINGKWEADATSMLQNSTFNLVKNHPNESKEMLDKLSDEKASSFWYFLFDGPHPNNEKEDVDLLVNLLGKDSKQSKLLLQQFQKLKVDWENH